MHVYLAGPIRGLTYGECTEWRDYATIKLAEMGHTGVSPMRGKDYLKEYGKLNGDSKGDGSYDQFPMSSQQGLFRRDIFDVKTCDVLLANFEGATQLSIGTCMEIQRAYDLGKYVITVVQPGSLHDHAFIRQASSVCVETLDQALVILKAVGAPFAYGFIQLETEAI